MKEVPLKIIGALALAGLAVSAAHAEDLHTFDSTGLPGSEGVVVRVSHPPSWRKVALDDPMALAEFRGPEGQLTAILQIGRGARQRDMEALCKPERARTMLQGLADNEPDARVTDVVARRHEGRPAYEIRYERSNAPGFLLVRSLMVCLKDTRLLVSCGAEARTRSGLADIEPVCRRVLDSLTISEE